MRIFKSVWFSRYADKEGITDTELKEAVKQLEAGQFDADLGGGVYKQRTARPGAGKSGGYRIIVFFRSGSLAFFVYGFAKSNQANITAKQLRNLKILAKQRLSMTDKQLEAALQKQTLKEIAIDEVSK